MADTVSFDSLLNTTSGMTAIVSNVKHDDDTISVTGVDWFQYAGQTVSTIYVNGNNWVGFGVSKAQLNICNRDGAVYRIYRQEGSLDTGEKFLKIRVEGYTYHVSTSVSYALKYEIFLIQNQTIFVNIVQIPTNRNYIGKSNITDGTSTTTLDISVGMTVPIYITVKNAGSAQEVYYELYPLKNYQGISVTTLPNKTVYYLQDDFDKTGMVISGITDDGESVTIRGGYTISGFDSLTEGKKTITISYRGYTTTFEVEVKEDAITEISYVVMLDHYLLGDTISVSSVTVKKTSGKTQRMDTGFEVTGFDSSSSGKQIIRVSVGEIQKQVDIYVSQTAEIAPSEDIKTKYLIGEALSKDGTYSVMYDDGYTNTIYPSSMEFSGFDSSQIGNCTITMKYRNIVGTYEVSVSNILSANIGSPNETDIVASLNIETGELQLMGTGSTQQIYSPSRGTGGLFDDGGEYNNIVKTVTVGDGITELIGACFYDMRNMTEATLPEGLQAIGEDCFRNCNSLKELTLPETVSQIGNYAFYENSELTLTILNKNVIIEDTNSYASTLNVKKIKGYMGSTAEVYATQRNVEFEALNTLVSIQIVQEPYKKQYWPLDTVNTSGLIVEGTDENGETVTLTNYTVEFPEMETVGNKNVTVKYKELATTYEITVAAPALEDIVNNSTGMKSGNALNIPWFMFDGKSCDLIRQLTDGRISFSGTVKISLIGSNQSYGASSTYYLETILNNGIRVGKLRSVGKLNGNFGEGSLSCEVFFFSSGDIYISMEGTTTALTKPWNGKLTSNGTDYTVYGPASTLASGKAISAHTSCYHKDNTGSDWTVKNEVYSFPSRPQKVEISTLPDKTDYFVGEEFDSTGMTVTLVYADGTVEESEGYTMNSPDLSNPGIQQIIVTDEKTEMKSDPFSIYVNLKKNVGYPNETDVVATTDIKNSVLNISGSGKTIDSEVLRPPFAAVYDYINAVTIEEGVTELGAAFFSGLPKGMKIFGLENIEVFGSYCMYSAKISGEINLESARSIDDLAFASCSVEKISIGKSIESISANAFSSDTITEIEIKSPENSIEGSPWKASNAVVTWTMTITGISIQGPLKKEYVLGEEFDPDGMIVSVVYADGSKEILSENDFFRTGFDSVTTGEKEVQISYTNGGKTYTATFSVMVYAETTGIRVKSYPSKFYYKIGDVLDTSGMEIVIVMADGKERPTEEYTCSELDSTTAGSKKITVTYLKSGKKFRTSFQVRVTKDRQNPFDSDEPINITVHWINGEFEDLANENIQNNTLTLQESICSENYFIFGGCVSNQITFQAHHKQFDGTDESYYPRGKIEVYMESQGTKIKIFTGEISSAERASSSLTRNFVAYDYLYNLRNTDITWWCKNQMTDKQMILTQKQFRDALFSYLGIEQIDAVLEYDNAYVPNTNLSNQINAVDIIKDLCLQNSVFGWMNRDGKFEYLRLPENSYQSGTTTSGIKLYSYYDAQLHFDTFKSFSAKEGRIWFPYVFQADPYPGVFYSGEPTAQEAYENNIYMIRNSFFVGNDDWLNYVFDADEYGNYTRMEPIMEICRGTSSKLDIFHLYRAQEYTIEVEGDPLNMVGQSVQLRHVKQLSDGSELEWVVNSYIMSRTLKLGYTKMIDTYSAKNGPYNGNSQQLGKNTPEISATAMQTRSELPVISYADFSDGAGFLSTYAADTVKKDNLRCIKRMKKSDYDALVAAGNDRTDTLYFTYEEE